MTPLEPFHPVPPIDESSPTISPQPSGREERPLMVTRFGTTVQSPQRLSPIPYGLVTGIATIGSVALILCCLVSVAGKLGPGRPYIKRGIITLSIASGIYVGVRSFNARRLPRRNIRGVCPDCGRELLAGDDRCTLCGRPTDAAAQLDVPPHA